MGGCAELAEKLVVNDEYVWATPKHSGYSDVKTQDLRLNRMRLTRAMRKYGRAALGPYPN